MPLVSHTMTVSQSNDPSSGTSTVLHLDTMLSELYGKFIRQGQNFRVKGVQCSLIPQGTGYDSGLAASVRFSYAPTTKHSRKAWNHAFSQWASQKKLAGRVGQNVNNDDFETTYSTSYSGYARTSTMNMGGMADGDADKVAIYGTSSESSNIMTLEDMYESLVPVEEPSRFHWNNAIIKPAKFTSHFPEERRFAATANLSTVVGEAGEFPAVYLGGARAEAGMVLLPESANVMCGHLEIDAYMIADDTVTQTEDSATLMISIWVESFTPLVYPSKAKRRGKGRKPARRVKTSRKSRK